MFKYVIVVFLLCVYSSFSESCCEEKERVKSYLDVAVDVISKAKSSIPSCPEKKECPEEKALDCADLYKRGYNKSGVYNIWPTNRLTISRSIDVYCDMDTDDGGWTVIQRRGNFGRQNDYFFKDWQSYKTGFGNISEDFWLGNDNIFALTNQKLYSIRFDLVHSDKSTKGYALYESFWIDDESNKYTLHISDYSGSTGDGMASHNNCKFSTKDQKNNLKDTDCAKTFKGAWWFDDCYDVHLNGVYENEDGVRWKSWSGYPLSQTEMKIRPHPRN